MAKPGPQPGSEGAKRISEAHKGGNEHDKTGGFAANPELAREAGRKGGQTVKERHGPDYFASIGKKGGQTVKEQRGIEFYSAIGRRGGLARSTAMKNSGKNSSDERHE